MKSFSGIKRRVKIPLYDIGAIVSGFYIGYHEGKGVYTNPTLEYLTKYGPTVFAVCMTPLIIKTSNIFGKWMHRKIIQKSNNKNLEIKNNTTEYHTTKKYKDLTEIEKKEVTQKMLNSAQNLESKLENQKYLKPTMITGTRTAIETLFGYAMGRIYSQI